MREQPPLRSLLQLPQHPRHGQEDRDPVVHGPEVVDAHPDQQDDDVLLRGRGGAACGDLLPDHGTPSLASSTIRVRHVWIVPVSERGCKGCGWPNSASTAVCPPRRSSTTCAKGCCHRAVRSTPRRPSTTRSTCGDFGWCAR